MLTDVAAARFFHGGVSQLRFDGDHRLVAGWDENAGWHDHFSLRISDLGFEALESHEGFDANDSSLWRHLAGTRLKWARILGSSGTPHVLELAFEGHGVVIADGYEAPFGDGDDLVHWRAEEFWADARSLEFEVFWESARAK